MVKKKLVLRKEIRNLLDKLYFIIFTILIGIFEWQVLLKIFFK